MFFSVQLTTVQSWGSRKGKSTGKITLELNNILQIETQHTLDLVLMNFCQINLMWF